jgi:hypothetical protein
MNEKRQRVYVVEREDWDYDDEVSWAVIATSPKEAVRVVRKHLGLHSKSSTLYESAAGAVLTAKVDRGSGQRIVHTAVHHG